VVAITAFGSYLRPFDPRAAAAFDALRQEFGLSDTGNPPLDPDRAQTYQDRQYAIAKDQPKRTLADFGDAVDYAVKQIGIDHVAVSSDFNHGGGVIGWASEAEAGNVTAELVRRGYREADIAKLWSGNVLRVWGEAQARGKVLRH
jgi:microsomal dipeptidase-like Zn-dependent dipeptidase